MFNIKYPKRFFNPLVSKHQRYYIEILLQIEKIIEQEEKIAVERNIIMNELRRYIERNEYEDISDEEEYDVEKVSHTVIDDLGFILRMFKKSGWIDIDESGNRLEDVIFITDAGKELTLFLSRLMNSDEQAGFVMNTFNNLSHVSASHENLFDSYVSIKNAYESTKNLIRNLEIMYSKIRRYYDEQLKHTSPELLLKSHFDGYINEIIDKVIFPLKVDDSIYRLRGPIIEKTDQITEDSGLIDKILDAAKKTKRIADTEQGRYDLLYMLSYIKQKYRGIDSVIDQIDDKTNTYTRVTRQKLTDMLSMDTTIRGNIISLIRDSRDSGDELYMLLSECVNLYDIEPISDALLYKPRKVRQTSNDQPLVIEDALPVDESEIISTINTYASKFTKRKVNEYANALLSDKPNVSSQEMNIFSDEDYVMSVFLLLNSTNGGMDYEFIVNEGQVEKRGYSIPDFNIRRKGSK